jgi:hypothetical protein
VGGHSLRAIRSFVRRHLAQIAAAVLFVALLPGCLERSQLIKAAEAVSESFRVDYERTLKERGTRVYPRRRDDAIYRLRSAALSLGMRIESYDLDLGYVRFSGPAPQPLNLREWGEVADADQPKMRAIVEPFLGPVAKWAVPFETEGLDIVINATAVPVDGGSEVSLSMRMREVKPPPSGFPRREYPPPTGVSMGLDKIWAAIDREMGVKARSP